MYGFLAQAVAFTDARLEAAYLYGRHLQRALPKEHSGTLDLGGDILLTHLRFEVGAEENVSPKQGADPTGAETGEVVEPVQPAIDYLSQIIQSINERHGSMLDGDDRVILEHVLGGMAANPGLVQEAHANSKENFLLVFSEPFEDKVMQTETSNKSFFERFFSDEEFHDDVVRNVGEEFHRRHGGDDQLAA
jgi:hypothetical protein